jgi:hypothetical protein
MAQVVECLFSKFKTLGSNRSTKKKKKTVDRKVYWFPLDLSLRSHYYTLLTTLQSLTNGRLCVREELGGLVLEYTGFL